MRAIAKRNQNVYRLNKANTRPPQTKQNAQSRWSKFAAKSVVLNLLLEEQHYLCCYSELRADLEGIGYHIEHVVNKKQYPQGTFDYNNLAASALNSTQDLPIFKAQRHEVFGGHASGKQEGCDVNRFISCHQSDCSRFFAYLSDGRVVPSLHLNVQEQERAQYTIDLLNLNSPYLLTHRSRWWSELDQLFQEHISKKWNLFDLAAIHLTPSNNKLYQFFSLTQQFFGPISEQVLLQPNGHGHEARPA